MSKRKAFKPAPDALKFPGGKSYLASRLWDLAPPHRTFLEAYGGGLAMTRYRDPFREDLLMKSDKKGDKGVSEIVGDTSVPLCVFWDVMRDPKLFSGFHRIALATEFNENLYASCQNLVRIAADVYPSMDKVPGPDRIQLAWAFFVMNRQSMMGLGKSFAPISTTRCRRGMNEQVSAWRNAVSGLQEVCDRLQRVMVVNCDGLDLLKRFNGPAKKEFKARKIKSVFSYLDPPYPADTRESANMYGENEMSIAQHEELLDWLVSPECCINVMISTYANPLYTNKMKGWRMVEIVVPNHMSKKETKEVKTELVYMNYKA